MKNRDDTELQFNKYPIVSSATTMGGRLYEKYIRQDVKHLEDVHIKELCSLVPTTLPTHTGFEFKTFILDAILGNMVREGGQANP